VIAAMFETAARMGTGAGGTRNIAGNNGAEVASFDWAHERTEDYNETMAHHARSGVSVARAADSASARNNRY
jgi:hypothetical protein